jgi:alkaline phosphatase D
MVLSANRNLRLGLVAVLVAGALDGSPLPYPHDDPTAPIDLIAFGSCAKERQPQPVWNAINAHEPDIFLFIGDNNYADVWFEDGERIMAPVTTRERFEEAYAMMDTHPGFATLRATTPLMATWDDHDYGANDAGKHYPLKQTAQDVFWHYYGLAESDPLWEQPGIYHARIFGEPGRRVQVIMLDTRYFRDDLVRAENEGSGPYGKITDPELTLLGDAQWAWLEGELRRPAEVRIIASSIQVVPYQHGWEAWGTFPHERQRLYDLIDTTDANGVIFISGDRHLAEISREVGQAGAAVPYPLWDFTSSGMTDGIRQVDEANRYRVGPVYRGTNYGLIRINWEAQPVAVDFENRDESGQMINRQTVFLDTLRQG